MSEPIPAAAIEAAAKFMFEHAFGRRWETAGTYWQVLYRTDARSVLEAAAPHMVDEAYRKGRIE